jgi:hypothetical protein
VKEKKRGCEEARLASIFDCCLLRNCEAKAAKEVAIVRGDEREGEGEKGDDEGLRC